MRPSWWRRGFTLSLAVGALLACGIREDEFDCENAVARLARCCPNFDPTSVDCTYDSACGPTYPALDPDQSQCILQSSCDGLVSAGVCERAAMLQGSDTGVTSPSVCPPAPQPDASAPVQQTPLDASLTCLQPSDCDGGQVCCGDVATISTACRPGPCPLGELQLCATASDCAPGEACAPLLSGLDLNVCRIAVDASVEASLDGPSHIEASPAAPDDAPEGASSEGGGFAEAGEAGADAEGPGAGDGF